MNFVRTVNQAVYIGKIVVSLNLKKKYIKG